MYFDSIQKSLCDLYPPFQDTSPTVLCQVISVVDGCYRGDALHFLFHFLLPAKHLLQTLQQHACLQYSGVLFRHEGWPLCVQEKVVVQLCPLDQRLLRPGDFYLLVSPPATPPPPLRTVSAGSHHVEQQEVSELALCSLFSMAWLDSVNREREQRGASRLERCLLSASGDVFRVPWEDLVYPQFLSRSRAVLLEDKESSAKDGDMLISASYDPCGDTNSSRQGEVNPCPPKTNQLAASSEAEDSEGEYVELTELPLPPLLPRFSPQKGSLTQSISLQLRGRSSTNISPHTPHNTLTPHDTHIAHITLTPNNTLTPHEKDEEERESQGTHINEADSYVNSYPEDSYSEDINHTHCEDSYTENNTLHSNLEDSYSEKISLQTQLEDSYSENNTQRTHHEESYSENMNHTLSEDSNTVNTHLEDTCSENTQITHSEDSYSKKPTLQTHPEDAYSENINHTQCVESNTVHTHPRDAYSENTSLQTHSEDSYSENNTQIKHPEDSHSEESNSVNTHPEDSYSEKPTIQTHPEDSYSENSTLQIHPEDSNSENINHTHSKESNTVNTHSEDSYSENTSLQTHSNDSYSEKTSLKTHPKDSYSENTTLQTHSKDSYSEKTSLKTNPKDSYSENTTLQTHSEVSYSENINHTHTEESNTVHTHSEDSYSENTTLQIHPEDSYSENTALQTHTEDSYSENNTQIKHPEDSHSEESNTIHKHSEDSYSEKPTLQTHPEDSYTENIKPPTRCEESEESIAPEKDSEPEECDHGDEEEEEQVGGGGRRTEDLQTEGTNIFLLLTFILQTTRLCLHSSPPPPPPLIVSVSSASPSGTRDRSGRALLTVSTWNSVWSNPNCDQSELLCLLLYYTSTLSRKEVRALGLTVLVDARRASPFTALFPALRSLQENIPGSIHTVLLLVNRDSSSSSSLRVDRTAVPQRVEQLTSQCEDVINLLQKSINILQDTPLPASAQDAELLLCRYKALMRSVLEDRRLVQWQQEGGASLLRLRREDSGVGAAEGCRAAVETVSSLYDRVDELLHRLVTLSNARTRELSFILDFSGLEREFTEVSSWLRVEGEPRLKSLSEPEDTLELLKKKQLDYKDFYTAAHNHCKRGEALLGRLERRGDMSSADLHSYEVKVHSFWARLQDFSQRVNATGRNIDRAARLYGFLDQAYGWALEGMRHLAGVSMEECTLPDKCQAVIGCLEDYQSLHPPIPDGRFQEMKAVAGELRGERGLRQWSFAWSKCQETKKMLDRKMERRCSDPTPNRSSTSSRKSLSGLRGICEVSSSSSSLATEEDTNTSSRSRTSSFLLPLTSSPITSTRSPHTPQHTPLLHRLFRSSSSSEESSDRVDVCSSSPSLPHLDSSVSSSSSSSFFSSFTSRRQQLRKTQSFDCPPTPEALRYGPCPRALSEPVRRGNTGVFIRGLEVSSSEAADRTLCPRTAAHNWAGQGLRGPGTPGSPAADPRPRGSKLRHIVEEMITTEREYVRSLRYIIHHYFPEMDRVDLPQDLRGKRSVVFGNLEKLLDFHSQFFLRELEACWKHPLRVPHCFLRHQEQFSLYALYSKNKPKSDALLANHGNAFFRRKQVELGDKMDLSSYLLKPVQRMSKYALLLTDLFKEVGAAQEAELAALQAATNMVKFQLRHGNDLLAMDAIRDCDVNLKEQGQLIRQDEFTVWTGRRKCQRHIFLFEELVLFSKPKKMEGGLDVFIYKHSFKTADVGLTETTGDDGLRFEIWFRRRTSKNQTFILQAATADVKLAWTSDVARILWTQATKNKEMRLKEMVSMGVGSKPFLDIQPSDAAISDRAVHYIMKNRGARTRASIAVSVFDHSDPFKRGAVTSDPSTSGPSSSGLLGPLNLHMHMYSQALPPSPAAEGSFITSCIEEDEQEHETSSQPSMTTESSGSSSRCLSGSTGSDSGCVSSHLQEALPEEPGRTPSNKKPLGSQYISTVSHTHTHTHTHTLALRSDVDCVCVCVCVRPQKPAEVIGPATVV
uniref:Pleckstrin homology domain containing, family G (with RhoGef domain) member 4 n=1 Tax=Scophthalmus maximus TaxID=52904 RepID=A0A8D2ZM28_SCOMX